MCIILKERASMHRERGDGIDLLTVEVPIQIDFH